MQEICLGDPEFFAEYYGNHRSLIHGNLTGMVHFKTSTPWNTIKAFKSRYFAWLTDIQVFLNYTKFKTETLVPCGFLVGALPGYLRRLEAEVELHASLGLDAGEIPFQLGSLCRTTPSNPSSAKKPFSLAIIIGAQSVRGIKPMVGLVFSRVAWPITVIGPGPVGAKHSGNNLSVKPEIFYPNASPVLFQQALPCYFK